MVFLDREKFEQVLLILVNLIIRNLKNLELINILINKSGTELYAQIFYTFRKSEPVDEIRNGGVKVSE
jgi:hypothetical protein